jgi:hypothetical protein
VSGVEMLSHDYVSRMEHAQRQEGVPWDYGPFQQRIQMSIQT